MNVVLQLYLLERFSTAGLKIVQVRNPAGSRKNVQLIFCSTTVPEEVAQWLWFTYADFLLGPDTGNCV